MGKGQLSNRLGTQKRKDLEMHMTSEMCHHCDLPKGGATVPVCLGLRGSHHVELSVQTPGRFQEN